jgi:UDP-glucose 4-epimerase
VDILDPEIEEIIRRERPEVINHHAAHATVRDSVKNPIFDMEVSIIYCKTNVGWVLIQNHINNSYIAPLVSTFTNGEQ